MIKSHKVELVSQSKIDALKSDALSLATPGPRGLVVRHDGNTGTAFDDPNYSPWDSVAVELVTGDSSAVDKAAAEAVKFIKAKQPELTKLANERKRERERNSKLLAATEKLEEWLVKAPTFFFEKIETSSWHKFMQARDAGLIITFGDENKDDLKPFLVGEQHPQIFLLGQNWANLLENAHGDSDEKLDLSSYRLPFENCCFELKLAGHRMFFLMQTQEDGETIKFLICIEATEDVWYVGKAFDLATFTAEFHAEVDALHINRENYILDNIAALCICLDAKVLETEVIRAPHKLNKQREKQGKTPLSNFNVVSLARRHRIANPLSTTSDGSRIGKTRLHFRRGHWRHYADHKTWISWMLVGNPDLGFIDKEYRA